MKQGSAHNIPKIQTARLKGKRVLVRGELNVPIKNGKIVDDFRLQKLLPTLKYILQKGGVPIVIGHLEPVRSVAPVRKRLQELLKKDIEVFENLRFHEGEKKNSMVYARELARFGDIYVNEAFSVAHRKHASIVGLPKLLPSYAGLQFQEEVKKLSEVCRPKRPFLFILGGAKFDTKIGLLKQFIKNADRVFVGGAIANSFFGAFGYETGKSIVEPSGYKQILRSFKASENLLLPVDVEVNRHRIQNVEEVRKADMILDAGPETLAMLEVEIKKAKFIVWNGPLGHMEKGYNKGTDKLINLLAKSKARVIIGGGDTHTRIAALKKENNFYHVSTGGGAMLDFLEDGTLPGIEALLTSIKK